MQRLIDSDNKPVERLRWITTAGVDTCISSLFIARSEKKFYSLSPPYGILASFSHLRREYNTRIVAPAIVPPTSFKLFEGNTHFLHSSLQGRVLFSVFFGIIVLGLGFLRRCDPSACKGMSAREYSYIHNKILYFDWFSALLFFT